jgi:hypothetical protein
MQRDDPRDRSWRGRDEDLELWGREMDQGDWMRGTYGPGGMPRRGEPRPRVRSRPPNFSARDWDWGREWWRQGGQPDAFGWTGSPAEAQPRQWHGRTSARGYQRSDERIREDVYERLMEHPYVDSTDVEVSVSQGEVTLEGTVPDRWEKRLAEDLAEGVFGVTEVYNRLRTGQTPGRGEAQAPPSPSSSTPGPRPATEPPRAAAAADR